MSDAQVEVLRIKDQLEPRPYTSSTAEETENQIRNSRVRPTRSLLRMNFIKKRKDFQQPIKFTETDSDRNAQFQTFKDDLLGLKETKVMEIGLQGSQPYTSTGSQTYFKRKVNKCLQIDEIHQPIAKQIKVKDQELLSFLDNVYPEMEAALQSNETIDIFQDDFDVLPKNLTGSNKEGAEISNSIKQTKNLFYLGSKGKNVSCIQFQPWLQGRSHDPIIAESFVQNLSFDERVTFAMKSSKSFILFWNYQDLHAIDPLLILTSPIQITTFQFNPKDPSIVMGGTINGQIIMWDLKNILLGQQPSKKKESKQVRNKIREISPAILSALQDPSSVGQVTDQIKRNVPSHKAAVVCLKWFPSGLQIQMKKSYSLLVPPSGPEINQFASLSVDGQILLWQKKFIDAHKKPVTDLSTYPWKAGFGFHLFRPQGGGQMGGSQFLFKKNEKKTIITGSTDQGQVFICDWSNRSADEAGSKNDTITSYWNQQRNYRPVVAMALLPSNQDIILTIYDFYFCVWKSGIENPLFTSMVGKGAFNTCGTWSPTRAGVIFIGKSNGTIDIWDFMDQSHKCTMQYSVTYIGLSTMKFHQHNQNILAVGSQEGTLHILELPFTLVRKIGDQDKAMNEFWNRQIESVGYFNKRFDRRYEESQQKKARQDLQERLRQQKEQKKSKREDQENQINKQYQEFSTAFLNEYVYHIVPEKQEEPKKAGKR